MNNIYDTANQLERDVRELPQFQTLKEMVEAMKQDEETKKLHDEFRQIQMELQQKIMTGAAPSEDEQKKMQEIGERVNQNETLSKLFAAEIAVGQTLDDIQRIFTKPLQEVYGGAEA